ncbi:response regulator [Gynuella sp.]|uniref:response regulator n=1 Tax=Gynuella sp. TaxID=2969146 RepID=UPI003D0F157A
MKRLELKRQILLLTITPSILMALIFIIWFSWQQVSNLELELRSRGESASRRLVDAVEYGLIANNFSLLQQIARATLNEPDARAINIYNNKLKIVAQAGPKMNPVSTPMPFSDSVSVIESTSTIRYRVPVTSQRQEYYVHPSQLQKEPQLGWVELEFSKANIRTEQYKNVLVNVLLFLAAIFLTSLAGVAATKGVITPLKKLAAAVDSIREGDLDKRIDAFGDGEIMELSEGINAMAESLQIAHREMQTNIDQATQDLRETLETIEIQNIELDMARREALEASRIKSEFLANMSHEIRTPLNGILGFTKLLLKSNLQEKQKEYARTIHSSSESLLSIINDVLDFAKIEAGKLLLDNRSMNLYETIEDVLTMLAPSAHARGLELVSLVYSDVPSQVVSDQLRIKQVLTNLVNNAVKFTQKGSVTVRVSLESMRNDQVIIRIAVTDTGIGLTKEQQKALFTAFQQADSSTAREYGGTGLGLVISKRLVEQMGGDIGLESERQKGSTFWFTIRADRASSKELPDAQASLQGIKTLLLEPHDLARISLKHILNSWDIEVFEASTPQEAIKHLQSQNDITGLIAGLSPEGGSATHLQYALEQFKQDFGLEIILLTTSTEETLDSEILAGLVSASISKPVKRKQLLQALTKLALDKNVTPLNMNSSSSAVSVLSSDTESHKLKILAVDDNAANLKLLAALLDDLNIDVTTASSGKDALVVIEHNTFDLIFMDIQMPQMDGIETTERIRSNEGNRVRTPIVALTAHALAGEKENLLARGLDDYLTKPIDEIILAKTITKWTGIDPSAATGSVQVIERRVASYEAANEYPSIDLVVGLERASGKLGLAKDMMKMLIDSLGNDADAISSAYHDNDHEALLEAVHKLHGACHYCGVIKLQKLAYDTESAIKTKNYNELEDKLMLLYEEIAEIQRWAKISDMDREFMKATKIYAKNKQLSSPP